MKIFKKTIFILGLLLFYTNSCLAITVQEQWTKRFSNMIIYRVSANGDRIGVLSQDEYLILNQNGEVIKKGKNLKYKDIAVSKDLFVLSGANTCIFDYSGKMVWEVPYHAYPYFSPLGNYLMLWEIDERINMYTKGGKKITDFPIGDMECEFSADEKYLLVPLSGLYKIHNASVSKIVSDDGELAHFEAEYLKNSQNIAIVYEDEEMSLSLRMYNPLGKILWKQELSKYRFLKRFDTYLLLMEDRTLRFLDYSGKIKYTISFEKQMFSGFISKELDGRNLFLLIGYDSKGVYLYFINNKGQIIYKHVLHPYRGIYVNEKADLIYTMSSSNDNDAVLTLKCYRIIY